MARVVAGLAWVVVGFAVGVAEALGVDEADDADELGTGEAEKLARAARVGADTATGLEQAARTQMPATDRAAMSTHRVRVVPGKRCTHPCCLYRRPGREIFESGVAVCESGRMPRRPLWESAGASVRAGAGLAGCLALVVACTSTGPDAAGRSTVPAAASVTPTMASSTPAASSAAPTAASAQPSPRPKAPPACLRTVTVGLSVQHRRITACERGTPAGVALVVVGCIHGDETLGWGVVDRLMAATVPTGVDLWLVRSVNPDGSVLHRRGNAHGVDENRNWPAGWQASSPGSSTYGGPAPLSEPETAALARFLQGLKPRTVVVFHSPLNAVDYSDGADPAVTRYVAKASGFVARRLGSRPGAFTGWFNAQRWHGTAITFEFARTTSASQLSRVAAAMIALARWRTTG